MELYNSKVYLSGSMVKAVYHKGTYLFLKSVASFKDRVHEDGGSIEDVSSLHKTASSLEK